MSTAIEATGYLMVVISLLVTGTSLINDEWKISSVSGGIIIAFRETENLWHSCAMNSAGIAECRDFTSLLALPSHVQACRALMIIALLLGLGAIMVSMLGLKCIHIGTSSDQTKGKLAGTGGIMAMVGGLCCMIAVSWYAYRVVQDFYDPFNGGMRFELGTGLYLGWGGAFLSILGGGLLTCGCRRASAATRSGYPANQGKVYKAPANSDKESSRAYV
ncbi:claudin 15-like a [Nelusetta ayraudi]|uniref:claudin 15-like a n=1 Tax=Nelusetta ayraudi TaxID=303726 RepID=UPI003F722579